MTEWQVRTIEQRNLLNPAFCAVVLWNVAKGYQSEATAANAAAGLLPIELAFVGASFVLRGQTRRQLPTTVRTSLATWIHDQPLERSAVAKGIVILRPYVREALLFGAKHGILSMQGRHVDGDPAAARKIARYVRQSSADVSDCVGQAGFVGRWLYRGGTVSTVLAMLGIQA